MPIKMNVRGFGDLDKELENLEKKIRRDVLSKALKKAAKPLADAANRNAPQSVFDKDDIVLSQSHIVATRTKDKAYKEDRKKHEAVTFMGPSERVYYAGWVENGTKNAAPHPYLEPTVIKEADNFIDDLGTEIWKELQKRGKK